MAYSVYFDSLRKPGKIHGVASLSGTSTVIWFIRRAYRVTLVDTETGGVFFLFLPPANITTERVSVLLSGSRYHLCAKHLTQTTVR